MADKISRICWKDEDEIDGVPIGPVFSQSTDGEWFTAPMEPYPGPKIKWLTKPDAIKLAESLGVPFQEV